jgi:polar amino acid transport system substrate-binding protein
MEHGRFLFLCLALSVLTPFCTAKCQDRALAAERQTIRMGYIEFTPVFYTDADGVPQGLLVDLARKVVPAAGYQLELESLPVKRMANSLIKGDIDLWAGLKTLEGFEGNTFAGESILLQICLNAYALGEVPAISKKSDLNQKMIIGLRGFSYGGWVTYLKDPNNEIDFIEVGSHESALKVLERINKTGTKCYLLDYEQPVNKALRTYPVKDLRENPINCLDAYFVVSKKTPHARTVLDRLESTYKELKKRGKAE